MEIISCKDFHPTKPINATATTSVASVPLFPSSHLWANNEV